MIGQAAVYLFTGDDVRAARLRVAGRPVVFRAIVAAVQAGVRRIAVPLALRSPDLQAALESSPRARASVVWLGDGAVLADEPTVLLPAAALAPAATLGRLTAAPAPALLAESLSADAPLLVADAALLAALRAPLMAGAPLGETLDRAHKARELPVVAGERWFVRVDDRRAAAEAEARLYGDLGSAIDTPLDRAVHRRLSRWVSRAAVAAGVGPNPVTVASGLVGLAAAAAFAGGGAGAVVFGLLLYVVAVVLDHADGEVARLTLGESRLGEWLDLVADTAVHGTMVLALGAGSARVSGSGVAAGLVGAAGVVLSGLLAKVRRPTPGRGLLDNLSSRDGFYSMLLVFVLVRLVAPGLLPALMVFVAIGSHAYWVARTLSLRRRNT